MNNSKISFTNNINYYKHGQLIADLTKDCPCKMVAGAKYDDTLDTKRLQLHNGHLTGRLI
jgi:hypothetical protein